MCCKPLPQHWKLRTDYQKFQANLDYRMKPTTWLYSHTHRSETDQGINFLCENQNLLVQV